MTTLANPGDSNAIDMSGDMSGEGSGEGSGQNTDDIDSKLKTVGRLRVKIMLR